MKSIDWLRLVFLSLLWGGSYIWIELALVSTSPVSIVFIRISVAAICLIIFCVITKIKLNLNKDLIIIFFIMGLLNNVIPFNLIAWGQTQTTASVSSILNATTPLFTVIVANYWPNGEKATIARISGVLLGIIGVTVLIGFNMSDMSNSVLGQSAILVAAISYAFSALVGKKLRSINPILAAAGMLTASSIFFLPIVLMIENPFLIEINQQTIISLLGLSILSTAIAYIIFYKLIASIGSNVMLVTLLMPISAILMAIIFLNEELQYQHILGLILVLIGLLLVDGRILKIFKSS